MQKSLRPRLEPAADQVCIGITAQQAHLEKQHAGGPDRGRSAEPRQNVLAEQKLDPEQKEGAQKNREAEAVYPRILVTAARFSVSGAPGYQLAQRRSKLGQGTTSRHR